MLVRFASDRRTNQGGAKRNKRMQKPPKIELVFGTAHISLRKGCTYPYGDKNETNLSMKKGTLIRTETIRVHISVGRSYSLTKPVKGFTIFMTLVFMYLLFVYCDRSVSCFK